MTTRQSLQVSGRSAVVYPPIDERKYPNGRNRRQKAMRMGFYIEWEHLNLNGQCQASPDDDESEIRACSPKAGKLSSSDVSSAWPGSGPGIEAGPIAEIHDKTS